MRNCILLILLGITTSCQTKSSGDDTPVEKSREARGADFMVADTIFFHLDDSLVVNNRTQVQYLPAKQSIVFFDNNFNRVVFYKLNRAVADGVRHLPSFSERQNKKIYGLLYDESGDGVYYKQLFEEGSGIVSYNFNTRLHEIFLLKKRQDIFESRTAPDPFIANTSPMFSSDSALVFSGLLLGEDPQYRDHTRKTFGRIDLKTHNVKYFINYPEEYYKKNWAGEAYLFLYTCKFKDNDILVSFPASHSLYILRNDSLLKMNGTNPLQQPEILPMEMDRKSFQKRKTKQMILDFYTRNYSYQGVFYIPGKKRIARILELPVPEKVKLYDLYVKPAKLLIFDENFNFLKEVFLPDYVSRDNYFVTEKGIYFYNKHNENENKAQYLLFSDL
ncbi:hypothetical protein [Leadbetterella sp. DM7]|uniref:DUF4221 family protein n=1 Tax=Leadbetterella sp. DM7 TaxID=3235085 RepID=UPI00349EC476